MDGKFRKVLLLEDSSEDVRLIRQLFAEVRRTPFEIEWVSEVSKALERLRDGGFDLLLVNLVVLGEDWLEALRRLRNQAADVPIIVLSPTDDETIELAALREGAQDCLSRDSLDSRLLGRSIHYALERLELRTELEQARRREEQEREIRSLEKLVRPSDTAITAQLFGVAPMRQDQPALFDELVGQYVKLLELALEQRAYKVDYSASDDLRGMADQLGFLHAGPRDVIDVYSTAVKDRLSESSPGKIQAYVDEGRLMALELMGYLVSFYRNRATGLRRGPGEPLKARRPKEEA